MIDWYYVENGQQIGPVSEGDFDALLREGRVNAATVVWRPGMNDWQTYGSLASLKAGAGWVTCNECKRSVPEEEAMHFQGLWICSACKPAFVQKLKEGAPIHTGMNYASFGMRFVARFIDGIILWVVEMAIIVATGASMALTLRNSVWNPNTPLFLFLYPLMFGLGIAYSVFFVGKYSATPGKMLMHLQIVSSAGERMTYKKAFLRFLAEMVSAFTCYIGYVMAAFDEERRALHDRICDTRVVQTQ